MRSVAIIILLCLSPAVVGPPAALVLTVARDDMPCIGALDVCHSADPAYASDEETLYLNERLADGHPVIFTSTLVQPDASFTLFLVPSSIEHPPRS